MLIEQSGSLPFLSETNLDPYSMGIQPKKEAVTVKCAFWSCEEEGTTREIKFQKLSSLDKFRTELLRKKSEYLRLELANIFNNTGSLYNLSKQ